MPTNKRVEDPNLLRKEVVSVGKHSMIYVVGQGLSRAVGFFMIPVYTMYIAPSNYGAMEMIEIIGASLGLSMAMGATHGMYRYYRAAETPSDKNKVISTIFIGFGLASIPIVLLGLALSGILSKIILDAAEYRYLLKLTFISVWLGMFCDFGLSYLRMLYRAKSFVFVTTVQLVIALSLNIWFVVYLRLDILGIFYSTIITQGIVGLSLATWVLHRVGLRVDFQLYKKLIRFGVPLIPSRIGLMLGFVSNRFFLRYYSSPDPTIALAQVGLYTLGHKFGVIISRFVNVPFNSFWAPRRMDLLFDKEIDPKPTIARVCTYATICSLYLALFISAGIENLIAVIADPRYQGAHVVVPFVTLSYVFLGLDQHFVAGILFKKKTIWSSYASAISLCIIVICNFLLVPPFGLIGAASAMVVGLGIRVIFTYCVSRHFYPIPFELKRLFRLFATALLTFLISQTITLSNDYYTFFSRMAFVSLFPAILFVTGFFNRGEIDFARQALRKVRKKVGFRSKSA